MVRSQNSWWIAGISRVALLLALLVAWPELGLAQAGKGQAPSDVEAAAADQPASDADESQPDQIATADLAQDSEGDLEIRYEDPQAAAALDNNFPERYSNFLFMNLAQERQIDQMADGSARVDRNLLTRYVQTQVAQLTRHTNIESMLDPQASPSGAEAIETAGQKLLAPLLRASQRDNTSFRDTYTEILLQVIGEAELMSNHLYARLMALMALSRSGSPQALPFFTEQLSDPNQPLMVKLLAAIGVTTIAQQGRNTNLDPQAGIRAAQALADFLKGDESGFWPVRFRALEALGSLRQSSSNPLQQGSDLSGVALSVLADPDAQPLVRAWAAWALGMIRHTNSRFNFYLPAYHAGLAAVAIGEQVLDAIPGESGSPSRPGEARRLTSALLRLTQSFEGDPGIRNAGLLRSDNPNLSKQLPQMREIARRIKVIATASLDLTRAVQAQIPPARKALADAIADLNTYLLQNKPQDLALVPDGPQFPIPAETDRGGGPQAQAAVPPAVGRGPAQVGVR